MRVQGAFCAQGQGNKGRYIFWDHARKAIWRYLAERTNARLANRSSLRRSAPAWIGTNCAI